MKTTPTERPILFRPEMVRAILEGRKHITRRTKGLGEVNASPEPYELHSVGVLDAYTLPKRKGKFGAYFHVEVDGALHVMPVVCPYGKPGDRLWVRESVWIDTREPDGLVVYNATPDYHMYENRGVVERADSGWKLTPGINHYWRTPEDCLESIQSNKFWKHRPSIFMPRWASRLTLELTDVRIERVQSISEEDAKAEGFDSRSDFEAAWKKYNGVASWDSNPWVWKIQFVKL